MLGFKTKYVVICRPTNASLLPSQLLIASLSFFSTINPAFGDACFSLFTPCNSTSNATNPCCSPWSCQPTLFGDQCMIKRKFSHRQKRGRIFFRSQFSSPHTTDYSPFSAGLQGWETIGRSRTTWSILSLRWHFLSNKSVRNLKILVYVSHLRHQTLFDTLIC